MTDFPPFKIEREPVERGTAIVVMLSDPMLQEDLKHDLSTLRDTLSHKFGSWISLTEFCSVMLPNQFGIIRGGPNFKSACTAISKILRQNGMVTLPRLQIAGDLHVPVFCHRQAASHFNAYRPQSRHGGGNHRTTYDRGLQLHCKSTDGTISYQLGKPL